MILKSREKLSKFSTLRKSLKWPRPKNKLIHLANGKKPNSNFLIIFFKLILYLDQIQIGLFPQYIEDFSDAKSTKTKGFRQNWRFDDK